MSPSTGGTTGGDGELQLGASRGLRVFVHLHVAQHPEPTFSPVLVHGLQTISSFPCGQSDDLRVVAQIVIILTVSESQDIGAVSL